MKLKTLRTAFCLLAALTIGSSNLAAEAKIKKEKLQIFIEPNCKTSRQYAEREKCKGISNRGYHYMGSAEFFVEAGDAFANAMTRMIK